jgi:hypothetical protein
MGDFSVFTGAVYLLPPPPLSHRPPHPETDSVDAVLFVGNNVCIALFRRKPLNIAFKSTNNKHENTGAGLSYSGRTASGISLLTSVSQQDRAV